MGFGGGGGGTLSNHVHNSIPLQGGPLDFVNDTISSMNAGSTTFSNGAALQELVIGNAGDSMIVNPAGTAPEWTAGGAAAVWTADGTDSSAGGTASLQVSGMTGRSITQILFTCGVNATTTAYPMIRVNGISTNNYKVRNMNNATEFTDTAATGYILDESTGSNLDKQYQGEMYIFTGNSNLSFAGNVMKSIVGSLNTSAAVPQTHYTTQGSGNQNSTADITQIDLLLSSGNIYGTLQVNSMDYQ